MGNPGLNFKPRIVMLKHIKYMYAVHIFTRCRVSWRRQKKEFPKQPEGLFKKSVENFGLAA